MGRPRAKIAIVGGGVAGASIALYLSEAGLDVSLFEKGKSLVNGPPICHLHAGGNLYREIEDAQCVTLIAVPLDDEGEPQDLCSRLHLLQDEYRALIEKDSTNRVLGRAEEYFKSYSKEDIERLRVKPLPTQAKSLDDWMVPVARSLDFTKLKFPLIMVQEYGLNIFRIAATLSLALQKNTIAHIYTEAKVSDISKRSEDAKWRLTYKKDGTTREEEYDFLINAAGFRSGEIDDMLGLKRERLVEFKAAYITKWESCDTLWPEVIFHGKRGTPKGMAQFTPYPQGYFQLHGMTNSITLFKDGLVKSSPLSAQPKLSERFIHKIEKEWRGEDVRERTELAIEHLAQYIPKFQNAKVTQKPLYGAQQIPGKDASLRAADLSFAKEDYVRCEIVKASSVLSMADSIATQLIKLGYLEGSRHPLREFRSRESISEEEIQKYAKSLCKERGYPTALAGRSIKSKITSS